MTATVLLSRAEKLEKFPEIFPKFFFFRKNINSTYNERLRDTRKLAYNIGIYIFGGTYLYQLRVCIQIFEFFPNFFSFLHSTNRLLSS